MESDIRPYYRDSHLTKTTYDYTHIYIKIRIPIASPSSIFSLFRIDILPVPSAQHTDIYTLITNTQPWFAIARYNDSYFELPENSLPRHNQINIQHNSETNNSTLLHSSSILWHFLGNSASLLPFYTKFSSSY